MLTKRFTYRFAVFSLLLSITMPTLAAPTQAGTWTNEAKALPGQVQVQIQNQFQVEIEGPFISGPVTPSLSPAVMDLPAATDEPADGDQPDRQNPLPDNVFENIQDTIDPLSGEGGVNTGRTPDPLLTFEGVGNVAGVSPPDTNGDVGPNHYVQMVNIQFGIFDKAGNLLSGPTPFNALFQGYGGPCESQNAGDPIVLYDAMADRWLLSQFASPSQMCVVISQTPDPTGAYWRYGFNVGNFPDYFKFGVWPDAYYMSANESSYTAYAFDRTSMLAGLPATYIKFTGQDNLLLPSDLDGATLPPAGAPNFFYTFKDNSFHGGVDRLEVFAFHVDWVTPGNTTFTLVNTIPIANYTYTVCGFFEFNCVPQLGTPQRVDAVSEWPMHRFPYRNFGTHETMIGNFAVDVGGDVSGIRWFELRRSGGGDWTLFQEGTHAPDGHHFFMGSIAMDGAGNIALGYSKSSASMFPAIRYATRLASDPPGTLQGEAILIDGSGSQIASNRWGDYSAMSIDPVDDCTFWYTNEYYPVSSGNNWHTRVGAFRIPSCGIEGADLTITQAASIQLALPGDQITYTISTENLGPLNIGITSTIIVEDILPVGAQLSGISAGDWTCIPNLPVVSCTRAGLAVGPAPQIAISILAPNATDPITNTAEIESPIFDPNLSNNTSSAVVDMNKPPIVDAGPDQTSDEGEEVAFNGSFTDPNEQPVPEMSWDFGDGMNATGMLTPTHTFLDNGLYTVTLTITDSLGGVGQDWLLVEVANVTPSLDMAPISYTIDAGQEVMLTGTVIDPGILDSQTVTIEWESGITETLNLPLGVNSFITGHIYASAGVFSVTVTVSDKDGASTSQSGIVTVNEVIVERKIFLPLIIK